MDAGNVCSQQESAGCRIRSGRSKHREVAWDTGEDAALHWLGFDTSPKSTSESAGRENTYELLCGNVITVGAEHFRCAELTTNPYRSS